MPTHPENLKRGDFIAIVKCLRPKPSAGHGYNPWQMFGGDQNPYGSNGQDDVDPWEYNGRPYRILSISLPFIAATNGEEFTTFDVRMYQFQKMTLDYVKQYSLWALAGKKTQAARDFLGRYEVVSAEDMAKEEAMNDPNRCPRCGGKQIERLKLGDKSWKLHCTDCGNEGGAIGNITPIPELPGPKRKKS